MKQIMRFISFHDNVVADCEYDEYVVCNVNIDTDYIVKNNENNNVKIKSGVYRIVIANPSGNINPDLWNNEVININDIKTEIFEDDFVKEEEYNNYKKKGIKSFIDNGGEIKKQYEENYNSSLFAYLLDEGHYVFQGGYAGIVTLKDDFLI